MALRAFIIILLLCTSVPALADEARLALGAPADSPQPVTAALNQGGETATHAVTVSPLAIGLVIMPNGMLRSPGQASQFATHFGQRLGVPVRAHLFESERMFVDWFNRLQALDLALLEEPERYNPLAGNYRPLLRLEAADGFSGLLVARRDLPEERVQGVLQALAGYGHAPTAGDLQVSSPVQPRLPEAPPMPVAPERPASVQTPPPASSASSAATEPAAAVPVVAMTTETVAAVPESAAVVAPEPAAVPEIAAATEPTTTAIAGAEPPAAASGPVPAVIAQPDLPQELRPPGVPQPRPARVPEAAPPVDEPTLLGKLQDLFGRTPKPPPLLPPPDPEPGVVYVVPFITLMVPSEFRERAFDQFVDTLNQRGNERDLRFVILKQGLDKIDRDWLGERKYVLGEIYGYVEDSGCCSTDLRTRARLTFYRAHLPDPALKYEYPVRTFFEHDQSNLTVERQKLADQVANVLADELFKALQP